MQAFIFRMGTTLTAGLIAVLALAAAPAHAFSDDEARRAILDLRTQIKQINEQNQQARLQLADQIDMLRHEVASMRGQIEQLTRRPPSGDQPENAPQDRQAADPQEQAAYQAAADQYRSGKYKEAAGAFASFTQAYPDSDLAGDARFYLGSSQYATRDFKGSVKTMQDLVKDKPQDPRSPDALLVAAASQIELNDMAGAKASLQRIIKDYPQASAAETAKSRLKLL
ncbi:tol-pal system protein YbgF [Castellaniella sp. GW247-6E4]|uniref:tol-pal system protein YbgF n=1 Tax=Castellaniella sp. GW247-6E4 TaxID=3140380 RepID=UPI0033162E25